MNVTDKDFLKPRTELYHDPDLPMTPDAIVTRPFYLASLKEYACRMIVCQDPSQSRSVARIVYSKIGEPVNYDFVSFTELVNSIDNTKMVIYYNSKPLDCENKQYVLVVVIRNNFATVQVSWKHFPLQQFLDDCTNTKGYKTDVGHHPNTGLSRTTNFSDNINAETCVIS